METTGLDYENITAVSLLTSPSASVPGSQLSIGDNFLIQLSFAIRYVANPIVYSSCFAATIINIATFSRMELSQGVNQNLLVLSCSDCLVDLFLLASAVVLVAMRLGYYTVGGMRMSRLLYYSTALVNCPLYVSVVVTTIIAVVRCASIVMPFTFRDVFTLRRQKVVGFVLSGIVALAMLMYTFGSPYVPRMVSYTGVNNSIRVLSTRSAVDRLFDYCRNTLFYGCLCIIAFSMVFLIIALKRSSQFRRPSSSATSTNDSAARAAAIREAQVVKTVIFVLAIFVMCNLPITLLSFMRIAIHDFSYNRKYALWYNLLMSITGTSLSLNTGLNFFAYYNCNSQYREIIKGLFGAKKTSGKKA